MAEDEPMANDEPIADEGASSSDEPVGVGLASPKPAKSVGKKAKAGDKPRDLLTVDLFDAEGKVSGDVKLPEAVFGQEPHQAVMHQALLRQLANARQGTAATKTRGLVSGGGAKPHRQKGTGRSRHGSIREPSMVGGGTVFGPQPRSYAQRMPRKMRRLALRSALSVKAQEGKIAVLEGFGIDEPRTAAMADLLRKVGVQETVLVVLAASSHVVSRSLANLPWAKPVLATNLSMYDLFTHDRLVVAKDAVEVLEETFSR